MTTMLSLILAFMLTIGGGPAANINISPEATVIPVNDGNSSSLNLNVNEKPRLGEISKIRLFEPMLIAQKARMISLFRINFKKSLLVGYYYYRNRYYMPRIGRFLQTDPTGYMDYMNLYQAFGMNPVNFNDPFGLQSFDEIDIPLFRKIRNWEMKVRSEYNYSGPFKVAWEQGMRGRPYVDIATGLGPMRLYNYELKKLHPYIDERDLLVRGGGLLQSTWGVVQIKMAAAIATASGGSISPLSVALLAMGADNIVAGSSKVITGWPQDTLLNRGLQEGAKLISDDPKFQTDFADYGEFGINLFTGGVAYNQLSQPGQMMPGTTYTGANLTYDPLVHKNINTYIGPQCVYEIRIDGSLYKYEKADMTSLSSSTGNPVRLQSQLNKLRRQFPGSRITGRVLYENPNISTSKIKVVETRYIQQYYDKYGTLPQGNQNHPGIIYKKGGN